MKYKYKLSLNLIIICNIYTHMSDMLIKLFGYQSLSQWICKHESCTNILNTYKSTLNSLLHNKELNVDMFEFRRALVVVRIQHC
jgi:hypothetical protein